MELSNTSFELGEAVAADVGHLATIARSVLPGMTKLHEPGMWLETRHLGSGSTVRDSLTSIVRDPDHGPVFGFCWVDDCMYYEAGCLEAWWCINALAILPARRGNGAGRALIDEVKRLAIKAGVASLHGVCYPASVSFWESQGFSVGARGGSIRTTMPVDIPSRGKINLTWRDSEGDHMFLLNLDTSDPTKVLLQLGD